MQPALRFSANFPRRRMAEALAPTYAKARNVDVNEAYARLETALEDAPLLGELQRAIWGALVKKRPGLDLETLVDKATAKADKRQRFTALRAKGSGEGGLAALILRLDVASGLASGEGFDLLASEDGQRLLRSGLELFGRHVADQLVKD